MKNGPLEDVAGVGLALLGFAGILVAAGGILFAVRAAHGNWIGLVAAAAGGAAFWLAVAANRKTGWMD